MRGGPLFEVRLESSLKTFVPLTRIQKLIGKRMLTSKRTKPCFYLERKADVTDLLAARHALSKLHGVKITSNSFLIHALALAARQYPLVLGRLRNDGADASLDSAVIDIPDEINVGFAVNSPQGLVVPVVKNADRKTLAQIADAVSGHADTRRRSNRLTLEEIEGETIAMSNLGAYDIDTFVGIVPPAASTILAVGKGAALHRPGERPLRGSQADEPLAGGRSSHRRRPVRREVPELHRRPSERSRTPETGGLAMNGHTRTLVGFSLLALLLAMFPAACIAAEPSVTVLWPAGAPGAKGAADGDIPKLTIYLPDKDKATGAAIVICPGGGYGHLAMDHEGHQIAQWLNSFGVAGFILQYRHRNSGAGYGHPAPLQDVQRAIRTVRSGADRWSVKPDRIGVLGFSAGGHLASTAVTHFDDKVYDPRDEIDQAGARPDFGVLIYPVISFVEPFTHVGSRQNLLGADAGKELMEKFSTKGR